MKGRNRSISIVSELACCSTSSSFSTAWSSRALTRGAPHCGFTSPMTSFSSLAPLTNSGAERVWKAALLTACGSMRASSSFQKGLPELLLR